MFLLESEIVLRFAVGCCGLDRQWRQNVSVLKLHVIMRTEKNFPMPDICATRRGKLKKITTYHSNHLGENVTRFRSCKATGNRKNREEKQLGRTKLQPRFLRFDRIISADESASRIFTLNKKTRDNNPFKTYRNNRNSHRVWNSLLLYASFTFLRVFRRFAPGAGV